MREQPQNTQTGAPTLESTADTETEVAGMDEPEGEHFEADADQLVKVVHQVNPGSVPVEGPTDFEQRGPRDDTSNVEARVTPTTASVREATPHRR
jgi:hypothetical protein